MHANVQTYGFAKGNYAAYMSPIHMNHFQTRPGALGKYKRGNQAGQKLRQVRDGLSKTALASEVRALDRDWDSRGVWAAPYPGGSIIGVNFHDLDINLTTPYFQPDPQQVGNVRLPNIQEPDADGLLACREPQYTRLQGMPCRRRGSVYAAPRSQHPGGVNLVLLDGAVGFLPNDVDPYIYAFLVSSDDRRAVDTTQHMR
jgi:hypothetical protein